MLMGHGFAFSIGRHCCRPCPTSATALTPRTAPDRAQLIVTSFVSGMGLGTFFFGPLSDRFGPARG